MGRIPDLTERITMRERPPGPPLLKQTWDDALFLHWRVPVEELRPLIPSPLAIDTHNGSAWVGVSPLTVVDSHPSFVPPMPWISGFLQVSLRTYVHLDGVPGLWFFSLDTNSPVAVLAGESFYRLPFHEADIEKEVEGTRVHFRSRRRPGEPRASLRATWMAEPASFEAEPGSLPFFWVERYCLYAVEKDRLYRARLFHEPWPLREVPLAHYDTTLPEANRISLGGDRARARLLAGGPIDAEIWPLEDLGSP